MSKKYIPNDKWAQRAAEDGYRARSVYKLMELDERFRLLRPGMTVIDVGAAPGSWLQYTSEKIGPQGRVVGFDLQAIEPVAENVHTFVGDMNDHAMIHAELSRLGIMHADLVLSDIAPNTSGIKGRDQWLSVELSRGAAAVARTFLKPSGVLVMKVFQGADFDAFLAEMKREYATVKVQTVDATRDSSKEVYVVCKSEAKQSR
ncbi:MAG: RlmE family RNA methyltransferase [Candidatus Peribacteraceae bacterium]